jgi:hypothetical protein
MSLITTADIAPFRMGPGYEARGAKVMTKAAAALSRIVESEEKITKHDIFLSHRKADADELVGLYYMFRGMKYTVYVDWKDDPELDRSNVTPETAARLRTRMNNSRCLFYATTTNAGDSKWMPWELGYKDGHNKKVAICPVVVNVQAGFRGQEYLGIYPYVDKTGETLFILRTLFKHVTFDSWLNGAEV